MSSVTLGSNGFEHLANDAVPTTDGTFGTGVPEAPADGKVYGRQNEQWTEIMSFGEGGAGHPILDRFKGKRLAVIGDSITEKNVHAAKNWPMWVQELLGMSNLDNKGLSGTSIAKQSGLTNSILERYTLMDANADVICVMGGTADYKYQVPIGTVGNNNEFTFCGAVESLIKGLIARYPTKHIVFFATTQRLGSGTDPAAHIHGDLPDYVQVLKHICGMYSIPIFDAFHSSGITTRVQTQVTALIPDKLHPNDAGQEKLGRAYASFILNSSSSPESRSLVVSITPPPRPFEKMVWVKPSNTTIQVFTYWQGQWRTLPEPGPQPPDTATYALIRPRTTSSNHIFIDVGFAPNQDTKVEVEYEPLEPASSYGGSNYNSHIFGSYEIIKDFMLFDRGVEEQPVYVGYGTVRENQPIDAFSRTERTHCVLSKDGLYIDGVQKKTFTAQTFQSQYSMRIFSVGGIVIQATRTKLYSLKVWDDNILIRDFIPVPIGSTRYSTSPAPSNCLWCTVTEQYYEGQGPGIASFPLEIEEVAEVTTP